MELTQEAFDKGIANLLDKVATKDELTSLATKNDLTKALNAQTVELKDYIHQSFETQQVYIDERIKELTELEQMRSEIKVLRSEVERLIGKPLPA
jgi:hypothetical protein